MGHITLGLLSGTVLGAIYFGGLLLTTQRLTSVRHPVLLLLASFVIRAAIAVAAFLGLALLAWQALAAALIAFLIVRQFFIHRVERRSRKEPGANPHNETTTKLRRRAS